MTEAEWIAFLQRPEIPAFNRAMLENPDDDLPRLVFADWMDENCPDTAVNTAVRESILTRAPQRIWSQEQLWRIGVANLALVRGRFDVVTNNNFRPRGERPCQTPFDGLWRANWVDSMSFGSDLPGRKLVLWFNDLHLATVSTVKLVQMDLWANQLRKAFESSHLSGLRELVLDRVNFSDRWVQVLADSLLLGQLKSLELICVRLGTDGLRELVMSPYLGQLRHLRLVSCGLDAGWCELLAECPKLSSLMTLDIQTGWRLLGSASLANSPYLCEAIRAQWRRPTDGAEA